MLKITIRIWKNTPMLGDHVSITTIFSYDKHWNGRFLGFDDGYVWLKIDGDQTPSRFYFHRYLCDPALGQRTGSEDAHEGGPIPLRLAIPLGDGKSTREIPLNEGGRIAFRDDPDHLNAKVFAESMHDNGLIIEKVKPLPFSWGCCLITMMKRE